MKHNYEGISFLLPDDWVDEEEYLMSHPNARFASNTANDTFMAWYYLEDRTASVDVYLIDDEHDVPLYGIFLESGLEELYDHYDYMTEENGYSVLNHGYVVIDDVNCYECEYVSRHGDEEYDMSFDFLNYELYIPCMDSNCIIVFDFDFEIGNGNYDRSEYENNEHFEELKRIRNKFINSIRI